MKGIKILKRHFTIILYLFGVNLECAL